MAIFTEYKSNDDSMLTEVYMLSHIHDDLTIIIIRSLIPTSIV
jgi:hypothetical protein